MPFSALCLDYSSRRRSVAVLALAFVILLPSRARAADVTIAWDPPADPAVVGYIVEYGTAAAPFISSIAVGNQTTWTFSGAVSGTTYVFRVRSYDVTGMQSDPSNEVSWTAPALDLAPAPAPTTTTTTTTQPISCTTPDPFIAMGGGTCYNGGWLPPGMAVPDSTTTTTTTTTTSAPPPTTVTSSSSCATPDPFAGMGGGTCYNGGWLPPGMPIPGGSTSPAPTPTTSAPTAPTAPATYSTATCTTPDPFISMGGGTCYNGGWLPPGMAPPTGTSVSSTSTPAPASSSPEPSSPTTCATPNPFVGIAGLVGYCLNGGWIPLEGQNGRIQLADTGEWEIVGEDGVVYLPVDALDPTLQVDGLRVFFAGIPGATENGDVLIQIVAVRLL